MNGRIDSKWLIGGGTAAAVLFFTAIAAWQAKGIDIPILASNGAVPSPDGRIWENCQSKPKWPMFQKNSRAAKTAMQPTSWALSRTAASPISMPRASQSLALTQQPQAK